MIDHKADSRSNGGDEEYRDRTQDRTVQREQTKDTDNKNKGKSQKKKKLEPSLKWKALGMEEYREK